MRKVIKTIFLIGFMWLALAIISKVSAATATISGNKNATAGDKVTVTVSIDAATWNLKVSGDASDSIVGYNDDGVNAKTTKNYTVTRSTAGTCTISLTGDVTDATEENSQISDSITINFKAKTTSTKPSGNSGSSTTTKPGENNTTTTKPKNPTFNSVNQTVYATGDVNLRDSWSTSSNATSIKKGTELKLTGTSTENINGYTWYRVTYNGVTKYIASSLITYKKPEDDDEKSSNKNLSSLSIEGVELTPKFDKGTTQYTAKVDGDISELKIDAKAEDSKSKVNVEGNKELKEGDNVIKVKVTAEDETTRTYFITVTKGEGTVTDTSLKLSELNIARVNFEGEFKPDTFTYELSLNSYVKNLDITAVPNQADAKVEITGNDEFVAGSNMVTILLTSADGEQTATYQIKVNIPEEVVEDVKEEPSMIIYIIIGIIISAVIIGIFIFIMRRRAAKEEEFFDDEYNYNEDNRYKKDELIEEEENTDGNDDTEQEDDVREYNVRKSRTKDSDVSIDDFLNIPDDDEKPRKPKGRHSL